MRTQIKITELNPRQWEYLTTEVPVNGRTFIDGLPRACVVFESPAGQELHVEMDAAEFTTRMIRLDAIRNEAVTLPEIEPEYMDVLSRPAGADQ